MLRVSFVQPDGTEQIIGSVAYVTVENPPMGKTVIATLADDTTWTFGPVSPITPKPYARVYVMNETGKTISTISITPGTEEAWDLLTEQGPSPTPEQTFNLPPNSIVLTKDQPFLQNEATADIKPLDPAILGGSTLQPVPHEPFNPLGVATAIGMNGSLATFSTPPLDGPCEPIIDAVYADNDPVRTTLATSDIEEVPF